MQWLAGYSDVVINPELGCDLCGYGFYLDRRAERVLDDLKLRALYMRGPDGGEGLWVACDLIGASPGLAWDLRELLGAELGLGAEKVLLSFSHTHSGPMVHGLRGLGEAAPGYLEWLRERLKSVALAAKEDAGPVTLAQGETHCEAFGYNRCTESFAPLEDRLYLMRWRRERGDILVLNYACHPVTLFRSGDLSADWPGAACRALEAEGCRAMVLQGFCGDVDPVTRRNGPEGWGQAADVELYGGIVARRALAALPNLEEDRVGRLAQRERLLELPLDLPVDAAAIREERERWEAHFESAGPRFDVVPNAGRFVREWEKEATEMLDALKEEPHMGGISVAGWAVGSRLLLVLGGEAYTEIGLRLEREFPGLMRVGYANGVAGYLPARGAYENPLDYAAYLAPKVYALFPFQRDVEERMLEAGRGVLSGLG